MNCTNMIFWGFMRTTVAHLRMSATGRSYTQIFLKFQYIIQVILSRKSMKQFTVTDEKIFRVCKAFDRKI